MSFKNYRVATDGDLIDSENVWHTIYETITTGAVLIRLDGHVVWRNKEMVNNPIKQLTEVFSILMSGNDQ